MFLTRNRKWRRILLSHNLHLRSSPGRAPLARPPSPTRAQRSPRLPPWSAPPAKRTCSGLPCCLCPVPVRAHTFSEDEPIEEGSGQPARVRGQTNTLFAGWFPALFAANMAVWRDGYFRVRRRISLLLLLRGRTATCWRKGEALNKLTERAHPERLRRRHQKNEKIRKKIISNSSWHKRGTF